MAKSNTMTMKRRRVSGEAREIRDQEWLRLHQEGKSTSAIAEEAGVSVQLVRRALARAREREASREQDDAEISILPIRENKTDESSPPAPRTPWWLELVPLFPIGAFTPSSECPHRGPIERGSLLCCMVCSASGIDDHPALKRDPATEPRRESRRSPSPSRPVLANPTKPEPSGETRRERRARLFANRRLRDDPGSISIPHSHH